MDTNDTKAATARGASEDLLQTAKSLGVPYLTSEELSSVQADFSVVSADDAKFKGILPAVWDDGSVVYLIADPAQSSTLAWLSVKAGKSVRWGLGDRQGLDRRLDAIRSPQATSQQSETAARAEGRVASPVVSFVDEVLKEGWETGASDVHFETRRAGLSIKYRLDGVLVDGPVWRGAEPPEEVLSRIKVMAELDIAERRVPQDGRLTQSLGGRPVDIRVSVMPNAVGEDAVLRILDKKQLMAGGERMSLDVLGFEGATLERIRAMSRRPHGMLLVTGPTGSGKTTTLYAAISETLNGREKVITIEDPIEYELAEVLQIPVNEKKGLTFSRGLRSILRHDPDTIFVGEIRDPETADIAVQSALTGHLVFTTVHANDVLDVIGRFLHMNVDMFSFMSALNCVVSQRLIRLLCTSCSVLDPAASARLGSTDVKFGGAALRKARGCDHCRKTGYLGRTVVCEVLPVDDQMRELVLARRAVGELKSHVRELVGSTMRDHALRLLVTGRTSLEEVERVLSLD